MTDRHDGGPAFPQKRIYRCSQGIDHEVHETGMSLRDAAALAALPAIIALGAGNEPGEGAFVVLLNRDDARANVAEAAWAVADAMIAARSEAKP